MVARARKKKFPLGALQLPRSGFRATWEWVATVRSGVFLFVGLLLRGGVFHRHAVGLNAGARAGDGCTAPPAHIRRIELACMHTLHAADQSPCRPVSGCDNRVACGLQSSWGSSECRATSRRGLCHGGVHWCGFSLLLATSEQRIHHPSGSHSNGVSIHILAVGRGWRGIH